MIGFVIGNGESRTGYNLERLRSYGPIYGCNALYRDFIPDVLIAVDKKMIDEILDKDVNTEFIYRQKDNEGLLYLKSTRNNQVYVDKGYASGATAVSLMCARYYSDLTKVFLIGFDIYSTTGKINNIYKGTPCYASPDRAPTYPVNWIEKLARVFIANRHIMFYRVHDNKNLKVPEWLDIDNIRYITYKELDLILERGGVNNGC